MTNPISGNIFRNIVHKSVGAVICFLLFTVEAVAQTPDPGTVGPHVVLKAQYDLGDLAFTPPPAAAFPANMEVRGSVHYPADLSSGPFPVLIWLHGKHKTCYETANPSNVSLAWPCPSGWQPITSYEGYDYAARLMASHGYIVISVSANAINSIDGTLSDVGMNARGVLVQHHLDLWNGWNTTVTSGPFGSLFVGKLDLQNVGTMGHSRGGEGIVFHAEYNRSLGSPYGIKAVITLAPLDVFRHKLNRVPLMNIAPYCDGSIYNLQGVNYYDDTRYNDPADEAPKHSVLLMGGNHNYFNTVWTPGSYIAGTSDDWLTVGSDTDPYCGAAAPGSARLDTTEQKAFFSTYAAAFYRRYLGKEEQFAPIINTIDLHPPASSLLDSSQVFVSYHPGRTDRIDINRVDTVYNLSVNDVGGGVSGAVSLVSPAICGGGLAMSDCDAGLGFGQKPHIGTPTIKGLGQMRLKWVDTTAFYNNDIPAAYQDFSHVQSLSFRACVNFSETTPGSNNDFTVQLIDSAGNVAGTSAAQHTNALFYPPGSLATFLPKVLFNTVRIPMTAFVGVDIAKIRRITFKFNRSAAGAVLISDIALINDKCGAFQVRFASSVISGLNVSFTNTTQVNPGDTMSYLWNFGNPASGVNDTSTLFSPPPHLFTDSAEYTVCLYATARRSNGTVCTDTFCTTLHLGSLLNVGTSTNRAITISPNPAKDYLLVSGAAHGDRLVMYNLYGQVIIDTEVKDTVMPIPSGIASGIYYVAITNDKRRQVMKVVVQH